MLQPTRIYDQAGAAGAEYYSQAGTDVHFMDQVRAKQDEAAMAYGRAELSRAAASLSDQEELQDALSLLAYDVPEASPCGTLLSLSHRTHLASRLTSAISVYQGRPAQSALHRLLCHAVRLSCTFLQGARVTVRC